MFKKFKNTHQESQETQSQAAGDEIVAEEETVIDVTLEAELPSNEQACSPVPENTSTAQAEPTEETASIPNEDETPSIDASTFVEAIAEDTSEAKAVDDQSESAEEDQAVLDALTGLEEKMDALTSLFKAKIEHSEYELEVARRYSEELQEYRNDLYQSIIDPLLRKVVTLAAGMAKAEEMAARREEDVVSLDSFALYREELEELLADYDIETYVPSEGDEFVSGEHKIASKGIPTTDETKARCIAAVKSKGYKSPTQVYAPAKVSVFIYEAPAAAEELDEKPASAQAANEQVLEMAG